MQTILESDFVTVSSNRPLPMRATCLQLLAGLVAAGPQQALPGVCRWTALPGVSRQPPLPGRCRGQFRPNIASCLLAGRARRP